MGETPKESERCALASICLPAYRQSHAIGRIFGSDRRESYGELRLQPLC
jgi:hypothetical protein